VFPNIYKSKRGRRCCGICNRIYRRMKRERHRLRGRWAMTRKPDRLVVCRVCGTKYEPACTRCIDKHQHGAG
jgi:hypothetical protein